MLTVDANVFVSAASATEAQHQVSQTFFGRASILAAALYCPTLLLPEVAAGIARPTGRAGFATRTVSGILRLPDLVLVEIDESRAQLAADAAITQGYGTTLITWDQEMLTRGVATVAVLTPTDWLTANPI